MMRPGLRFVLRWEAELSPVEHRALSLLLLDIFPNHPEIFQGLRSWSGAQPEARVVGYADDVPVAHVGFLRRYLRLEGGGGLLVGDVGLVGVRTEFRGAGVGQALLAELGSTLELLEVPFGFLTCLPTVVPFYERGNWVRVPGQLTRMIDVNHHVETWEGPAMVLAVSADLQTWPRGVTVVRDGLEV